ncbi:leishmanolysin family protein, putative [Ichthyophthirius multifiliis]|uniref:Leishmanolysin family protein, putative n=1 Tax=Ichthyophthirius multifiliis TaxID=5932 RepID=G0R4P3_ICHMU|nr:leishmanolysin family protein, putative [Ichthyophthirius multifiliis]EGR27549.1 leishmanolysin family protein, putative [Ichthyophthirius multifiliis]|eukprot:XP_004025001.1 leishmanolysin family protein, putative [Ichthyophthirius multifiliis]
MNQCAGVIIDEQDESRKYGTPNSDLHIIVVASDQSNSFYASATVCQMLPRPSHGKIDLNKQNFNGINFNEGKFNRYTQLIIHEVIHLLGFSDNIYPYFINKATGKYYSLQEILITKQVRGLSTQFIKTPKVLKAVKELYACEDAEGMKLENQGTSSSVGSHWEKAIASNEIMGPSLVQGIAYITKTTIALLDDSGFYESVNYDMAKINAGYDLGCDFFYLACKSQTQKYDVFCSGYDSCDDFNTGYSTCISSQYSDGCNIYQTISKSQCNNPNNSHPLQDQYSGEMELER